ncbi:Uric acid permease PucJ [Vagococcus penaei]|uniref:Uric acid permease PucJ n=1 Tax=Vagococcus penaei TaxID=633807 RepID=A0A1Q2D7K6_9ENTE|nr:nucleobase:cation symporter-2 family protein [Vagococcus penaei]AQP54337.1 Uric acid permease PucJ [Vagococcus penaei]RSU05776.1 Uric acid permease PucJ [Vagococcus penaei]
MPESHGKSAILGLQHLLAMYAGAVAVPLLIGQGLGFSPKEMTYLISIDIFMCGVATLLQLTVTKHTGIGLPVVLGCAIQAVAPLILIGSKNGIGAMYGSIIAAGVIIVLISGFFSKIKRFLPTVVTGSVITVIGLTLIPISVVKLGGGDTQAATFGNPQSILLGLLTVGLIVMIQILGKGFLKSISVLLGLVIATIVAYFLGDVSFQAVSEASWFHFPQFFYFGKPTFDLSSIILMTIISLISLVESTGVYFALGDITGKKITETDLKKGYRAEGLAVILGGLFNTFPYTGFSQNVGLVQLSGIRSKRPVYYSAFFLMTLGLLPKIGAFAQIIPESVLGGGMLVMFGMVAVQGLKMLATVDLTNEKNLLLIVLAIGVGLGFNSVPNLFAQFPETVQMFTNNGIVMTSLVAIILNILFNELSPKVKTEKTVTSR